MSMTLDGPRFIVQPRNVAGNEGEMRTLKCAADGNPEATYYWTKGSRSREVRDKGRESTMGLAMWQRRKYSTSFKYVE